MVDSYIVLRISLQARLDGGGREVSAKRGLPTKQRVAAETRFDSQWSVEQPTPPSTTSSPPSAHPLLNMATRTTPLRRISRGSLTASIRSGAMLGGDTPLSCMQDALSDLCDETAVLQSNLEAVGGIQESLGTFNENFATFLYGLKMNAFCVEWPEVSAKRGRKQLDAPSLTGRCDCHAYRHRKRRTLLELGKEVVSSHASRLHLGRQLISRALPPRRPATRAGAIARAAVCRRLRRLLSLTRKRHRHGRRNKLGRSDVPYSR